MTRAVRRERKEVESPKQGNALGRWAEAREE